MEIKYFLGIMTDSFLFSILITIIFELFWFFFVDYELYTLFSGQGYTIIFGLQFLGITSHILVTVLLLKVGKHETQSHEPMMYSKCLKMIFCPLLHACIKNGKYLFQVYFPLITPAY